MGVNLGQGSVDLAVSRPAVASSRRLSSLRAFRHRNFVRFWLGAFISNVGTWMETIGVGVYVTQTTGRAGWTGTVAALMYLPTLVFGPGDILINNIAWMLRNMPVFGIPGLGHYRLQPVDIEDVADIAVNAARHEENITVDAAGPEILTYMELLDQIAIAVRRRPPYVYLPPSLLVLSGKVMGVFLRDVILTAEEVKGLMMELLVSDEAPQGTRRFDDWLLRQADTIGRFYASELDRHFRMPGAAVTQTGPRPAQP